ncbi:MAG: hypothetical protein MUP55_03935 [Candidatus Aenigmarchaeota archaeon]|nr:hypothetical protein [Candidatus Aenigmarchaeota archaeon]
MKMSDEGTIVLRLKIGGLSNVKKAKQLADDILDVAVKSAKDFTTGIIQVVEKDDTLRGLATLCFEKEIEGKDENKKKDKEKEK